MAEECGVECVDCGYGPIYADCPRCDDDHPAEVTEPTAVRTTLKPVPEQDARRATLARVVVVAAFCAFALAVAGFELYRLTRLHDVGRLLTTRSASVWLMRILCYGSIPVGFAAMRWLRPLLEHFQALPTDGRRIADVLRQVPGARPGAVHLALIAVAFPLLPLALRAYYAPQDLLTVTDWSSRITWDTAAAVGEAISAAGLIPGLLVAGRYRTWRTAAPHAGDH